MAKVGDKVASYTITGLIGRGAMASVYRAHDERLNRDVALKLLDPAFSMDFIFRARFEREYRVTALLRNDHIVPVYDGGTWEDQLYIVMMLVDGPNLAEVMKSDGPLGLPRVVTIVNQIADGLDEAHSQRVIHRDVKPANVLMARVGSGGSEHIYLADFGLTLGMEGTHLTRTGGFMGTLAYTAPEQLNSAPIDGRADEYALAATTFQMLTGEMPFMRDNEMALVNAQLFDAPPLVTDLRPDLSPRINAVIARGMAKKPEDRYPSAGAFAKALAGISTRAVAPAGVRATAAIVPGAIAAGRASGGAPRGSAAPRGNRAATGAVILGLIGALVLGAVATYAVLMLATAPAASTGSPPPATNLVAAASPTVAPASPDATAETSAEPTLDASFVPSLAPGETPRPTPKGHPATGAPPPTPTATPIPTPTPTPITTPTPTPTPPTNLPLVAGGSWSVDNSPSGMSGSPYVVVGEHQRRYVINSQCDSEASCRLAVNTFDSQTGRRLGAILFKWNGGSFGYRGAAQWYSKSGGSTCQTTSGDLIADAYTTHEEVNVTPQQTQDGVIVDMTGTKTISGTPTAAGAAAGCAPFAMTYNVAMNTN